MIDYQDLLNRARAHYQVAEARSISEISMLLETFGAEVFDFARYTEELVDEFVNPGLVVAAYSISDPALLASRANEVELRLAEWPPEEDDYKYSEEEAEWNAMQDELSGMQRVIVLVEQESGDQSAVGNFRVIGFAQWLRETLWAATGVLPRDPGGPDEESHLYYEAFALFDRPDCAPAPIS